MVLSLNPGPSRTLLSEAKVWRSRAQIVVNRQFLAPRILLDHLWQLQGWLRKEADGLQVLPNQLLLLAHESHCHSVRGDLRQIIPLFRIGQVSFV